jgi:hypothetical protein
MYSSVTSVFSVIYFSSFFLCSFEDVVIVMDSTSPWLFQLVVFIQFFKGCCLFIWFILCGIGWTPSISQYLAAYSYSIFYSMFNNHLYIISFFSAVGYRPIIKYILLIYESEKVIATDVRDNFRGLRDVLGINFY